MVDKKKKKTVPKSRKGYMFTPNKAMIITPPKVEEEL